MIRASTLLLRIAVLTMVILIAAGSGSAGAKRKYPRAGCPLSQPGSSIGLTISGCATVASDTASNPDPLPFWGSIDCQTASRHQQISPGGDPSPTGSGAAQGDTAFRRLTVLDGDDFWGERCELGRNWRIDGPTVFYHEGERRVTFISLRLPAGFALTSSRWQDVMQMKQTQPYYNTTGGVMVEMQVREGLWIVRDNWNDVWATPAQVGRWTRFAFDIVYSQYSSVGSIKTYVDLNGDGDAGDAGEQSPLIRVATLKAETAGGPDDGIATGESIPSHLRSGLYHDATLGCPSSAPCSVDVDNVQVIKP